MRRKLSLITMMTAWLLATGSHWDLVQTFAWGRMIANYSQSMPLAQAIKLTFTPDNLCGICESVSEAKQQDTAAPTTPSATVAKAELPLATAPEHVFVFCSVPAPVWPAEHRVADACARPAPPTEPPRAA